jgi:putative hydroxymethylpyrimidine transport system permease protein
VLRNGPAALVLVALVALWQLAVAVTHTPDYVVPAPLAIGHAFAEMGDVLLSNAVITLEEAVLGFLLSVVVGYLLALAIYYSATLERTIYPLVVVSQTLPIVAIAPVLTTWFGFATLTPKVVVAALISFFSVVVAVADSLHSVDAALLDVMRTFGTSRLRLFRIVLFPASLPGFFTGAKLAATFSVSGAIFGEYVGSEGGLGQLMQEQRYNENMAAMFAAVVLLALMGVAFFGLVSLAERMSLPWLRQSGE